ncbi:MAG: RluA family pseudouridine synthase [Caldilinea sp.]|nr:RluA family pseudouridine synthase [Caldilineaceae bacterium]MCB9122461.1 RluA family pseudouridine synthase [Caldilineaceae bacterium]MCW5845092.1 RluA family pseudouridine synthase [Caldilinea sp.]
MTASQQTIMVEAGGEGQRLDRWLAEQLPDRSRSEIQRWIKEGLVAVDGQIARASARLEQGQQIELAIPEIAPPADLAPEALPLTIVYEDDDLLVVDKPAGMVVHPAPGHSGGTLVNAVLHHCPQIEGVGGERRPGIVHRLDKETSGLIVVAKNDHAHRFLQAQFKDRTVYKEYLALVEGRLTPARGRITAPIGRHPDDRKRQAVLPVDPQTGVSAGRDAITDYNVLGVYAAPGTSSGAPATTFSLVSAELHTGRTHQIRVHFAWYKHPIVGDTVYGLRKQRLKLDRHFLHAHRLRLRLPSTGEAREFVAPLPAELQAILDQLELRG